MDGKPMMIHDGKMPMPSNARESMLGYVRMRMTTSTEYMKMYVNARYTWVCGQLHGERGHGKQWGEEMYGRGIQLKLRKVIVEVRQKHKRVTE